MEMRLYPLPHGLTSTPSEDRIAARVDEYLRECADERDDREAMARALATVRR